MLTLLTRLSRTSTTLPTYSWIRYSSTMSSVNQFVADVQAADPTFAGESEKDKAEVSNLSNEAEGLSKDLSALNEKLTPLTYLYSNRPTLADVSLYCHLHPQLVSAPASQHPSQPSILRYFLQIQALSPVQSAQSKNPNSFPPLDIDISSLTIPERKVIVPPKKEKKDKKAAPAAGAEEAANTAAGSVVGAVTGAVAAAGSAVSSAAEAVKNAVVGEGEGSAAAGAPKEKGKKEKKEKKEKPKAEVPVATGPMPSMIDMRVGKVVDVKKHPEADSLYVEQIDVGEAEPRTVCSGLVKYMTEDEIRGATIIVICNLKPVTMRGVKSYAMLLCASSKDGKEGGVEFVLPPAGSQPGERIYFEGERYENAQPEAQLNPKKKVFETIQPGFVTLDNLDAAWVDPETKSVHKIRTKDGVCKAKSFVGASLS